MPDRIDEYDPAKRAAQVRRTMLNIARLQAGMYGEGYLPATNFMTAADHYGRRLEHDDECIDHLGFLVSNGLLEEWSPVAMGSKRPTFRERRFRITVKGRRLWAEEIDPIPGIDDARFGE